VIKVQKHPICCDCNDCKSLFPPDRFDVTWSQPDPSLPGAEKATAQVPIGPGPAALRFHVWIDAQDRLVNDWPGFPGTSGAHVKVRRGPGNIPPHIIDTRDPILGALRHHVPLRRRLIERFNARCMVEFGIAPMGSADHIPCDHHDHGAPAQTCTHLRNGPAGQDAVVLYGLDGDLPDCFCPACVEALANGDLGVCETICSRCQQHLVYRHNIVRITHYGAAD
jgi:hypothetical protein